MSNFPLLSIIMPCYNVADTFSRAIDSILMQATNFEYEIIIVNDASTDDSVKLFERYEKEYPFVRILNNSVIREMLFPFTMDFVSKEKTFAFLMEMIIIP